MIMRVIEQDDVQSNPLLALGLAVFALLGVAGTWLFPAVPEPAEPRVEGDSKPVPAARDEPAPAVSHGVGTAGETLSTEPVAAAPKTAAPVAAEAVAGGAAPAQSALPSTSSAAADDAPRYRPPAAWTTPPQVPAWPRDWGSPSAPGGPGYWPGYGMDPRAAYPPSR
ncbi:hypothetical protein [endosymbiont of unidentified scaly snail isolate Monju]|uniref:hypothetical protein n=1 Tax=endosymbiont of unidentified scaly snail isolate Monju TaxID=1248727 RepID=UPI0011DCE6EA|nr:hypothetical protein [endosymbiont of unidentified scaly snail isolate Monju]